MNDEDNPDFAKLLPGVKRMQTDRVNPYQQRKQRPPLAIRSARHTKATAAHPSTATPARDSFFRSGLQLKLQRKIRQGSIRPEAELDLHGYRENEAIPELANFISMALDQGCRLIIIIHGQGYRSQHNSILKPLVQRWLAQQTEVLAWCPAQPRDGAAGASYVYLAKR